MLTIPVEKESLVQIPKLKFNEPRHNLPGRKGIATAEDRFTIGFARSYLSQYPKIHRNSSKKILGVAREIPANGYGIADLIAVASKDDDKLYSSVEQFIVDARPCSRAFECKLVDWRKAMKQAARYRFFAHQAIVVLPEDICCRAIEFRETFFKIKVGLWSFDPKSLKINPHYTPKPTRPVSFRYWLKTMEVFDRTAKRSLPIV